jgi:hypothetical protein
MSHPRGTVVITYEVILPPAVPLEGDISHETKDMYTRNAKGLKERDQIDWLCYLHEIREDDRIFIEGEDIQVRVEFIE